MQSASNGSALLTNRWLFLMAFFACCFGAVALRLFFLQVLDHERMMMLAFAQQQDTLELGARRGMIYDRRMNELAGSVEMPSVYVNPRELKNRQATLPKVCEILELNLSAVEQKIGSSRQFRLLKKKITPDIERQIKGVTLPGIHLIPESKRFYPQKELASQLLGYLDADDRGVYGLEKYYDKELSGQPGRILIEKDARQKVIESRYAQKPVPGRSLILTIDKNIQFIVEQELSAAVAENNALGGTAILMNPENGEILALANYPDFNPNRYSEYPVDHFRNRAVMDVYEPGSTFKVVTIGSALDEGILNPEEKIDCQNGEILLANHIVKDVHPYGLLDFKGIIIHSSNIGAIKIGMRLGKERFYQRILSFNLGRRTGIDLPGEIPGLLQKPESWSAVSAGFLGMGYEIGVTPLQMVSVISAVANGGYWVKPHLVKKIVSPEGDLVQETRPEKRQLLRESTIAHLRSALEAVVSQGTARSAMMEQYSAAGKTGTAKKQDGSGYLQGRYMASFIGYAPASRPAFSAIVVIDEPHGGAYMGGAVAAPIFKRIAEKVLRYLEIPPEKSPSINTWTHLAAANRQASPVLEKEVPPEINTLSQRGEIAEILPDVLVIGEDDQLIRMPDFRGKTIRTVLEECSSLGIEFSFQGMGVVIDQDPQPGTLLIPHSRCTVRLSRVPVNALSQKGHAGAGSIKPRGADIHAAASKGSWQLSRDAMAVHSLKRPETVN